MHDVELGQLIQIIFANTTGDLFGYIVPSDGGWSLPDHVSKEASKDKAL
jgi:hypothetical protein